MGSGVLEERSVTLMPMLMPMDMVVMEAVLLFTQLVPLTVDVPSGVSVERDLPNHGDSATTLFLETLSSPEAYLNIIQEEFSPDAESVLLNHSDMDSTTMPFPEDLSFANLVLDTTQEVFSAVNKFL